MKNMRRHWRTGRAAALAITLALAATLLAPGTADAQEATDGPDATSIIHVFFDAVDCETGRMNETMDIDIADILLALESYASANSTYQVDDSWYVVRSGDRNSRGPSGNFEGDRVFLEGDLPDDRCVDRRDSSPQENADELPTGRQRLIATRHI